MAAYTTSKKASLRQKHDYILPALRGAIEIGDRIFDPSTAGENIDLAREGRVKEWF